MEISGAFLAAVGAGLAIGISGMGSGIGVGITGAAASGVVAEKPEKFGKSLIFQALPQTQAIYGLVTAILILMSTGLLGGNKDIPLSAGLISVACGLAVGFAGLSAIGQGISCASGVGVSAENDSMTGKGLVFSALPETQAIYGLVVAVLLMSFSGMLTRNFDKITTNQGLATIGAGLAIGIAGLSAIGQGITCSGAIGAVSQNPGVMGKGLIFAVMSETFAIFGLVVAILIMLGVGLI